MMIDSSAVLGMIAGALAGLFHAGMLWQGVRVLSAWSAILGLLRIGVVGAVLVLSALHGQIVVTAAAWAVSFFVFAVVHFRRAGRLRSDRRADCLET